MLQEQEEPLNEELLGQEHPEPFVLNTCMFVQQINGVALT